MSGEITVLGPIASDGEEMLVPANGGDWWMAWHPPAGEPPGQSHGANAFCLASDGAVVLISSDGERWGWPGGVPSRVNRGNRHSAGRSPRKRARP